MVGIDKVETNGTVLHGHHARPGRIQVHILQLHNLGTTCLVNPDRAHHNLSPCQGATVYTV